MMDISISNEILKLIQKSQTTVMKLYRFVNGEDATPTPQEFEKFKTGLIASIKRKKENALELFPIIKYFESKRMTDVDYQYDNVIFTVPEDEKIAIASPIETLEEVPEKSDYDLHIPWDLTSTDEKESKDFKAAENYFNIIKDDENLKRFVKFIGTHVEENWEYLIEEKELFYENVPQEVHALYQSGDLNNLLPIEIMQLDDPDLETVFLKNFIETKLLTYQLWGIQREIFEEWVLNEKDSGEKGPMFICLDTSGSMRGMTEIVAKAITMMVVNELERHGKKIVFIPFSMEAKMYDFYDAHNKLKMVKMQLKKSYYGGTVIDRLFEVIDSVIHQKKFNKANVLIISDLIFKNYSRETIERIKNIKEKGHKVHALNVSEKKFENKLTELFNSTWSYTFNWKGVFDEDNEDELINELSSASAAESGIVDAVQTFGILKKLKDNDFVAKTEEELAEENEKYYDQPNISEQEEDTLLD